MYTFGRVIWLWLRGGGDRLIGNFPERDACSPRQWNDRSQLVRGCERSFSFYYGLGKCLYSSLSPPPRPPHRGHERLYGERQGERKELLHLILFTFSPPVFSSEAIRNGVRELVEIVSTYSWQWTLAAERHVKAGGTGRDHTRRGRSRIGFPPRSYQRCEWNSMKSPTVIWPLALFHLQRESNLLLHT